MLICLNKVRDTPWLEIKKFEAKKVKGKKRGKPQAGTDRSKIRALVKLARKWNGDKDILGEQLLNDPEKHAKVLESTAVEDLETHSPTSQKVKVKKT